MQRNSLFPTRPLLPREHGGWAMFLVPLVIGLAVGWRRNVLDNVILSSVTLLLFVLAAFGFFLVRYPLMLWIKTRHSNVEGNVVWWSGVYGAVTFVGGVAAVVLTQVWELVIIGLIGGGLLGLYLWLATRRWEMSVVGQWSAIAGATLAAPGAYLLYAHRFDLTAAMLYVLCFLFFGGTVYYIKFKVREQPRLITVTWRERLWAARAPILYSLVAILIVALLAMIGWVSPSALLALLVPVPKVLIGVLERPMRVSLPRLGIIEIVHSIFFALVMIGVWS